MRGRTHLAMGIAFSLAASWGVTEPTGLGAAMAAVAGGAIGGVLADIDLLRRDRHRDDALAGQLLAWAVAAAALAADHVFKLGVCAAIAGGRPGVLPAAAAVFLILWLIGFCSGHRQFTHSLLAAALFAGCFEWLYAPLGLAAAAGYASHLLLDLLNKKDLRLFWPFRKGICLKLFRSDKTADTVMRLIGWAAAAVLLGVRLYRHFSPF